MGEGNAKANEGDCCRKKMKCHTWNGVFIPGCWGAIRAGKEGCYCYRRQYPDLEAEIMRLQGRIAALEEENESLRSELEERTE